MVLNFTETTVKFGQTILLLAMKHYEVLCYKEWKCWISREVFTLKHAGADVVTTYRKFKKFKKVLIDFSKEDTGCCCGECSINISDSRNKFDINIKRKDFEDLVLFFENITNSVEILLSNSHSPKEKCEALSTTSLPNQFWSKNEVASPFNLN